MADEPDGETSPIEALAILAAIAIGLSFFIVPETASLTGVRDIIQLLPEPGAVGTKGQFGGVIAILTGLLGALRRYLRDGRLR